ncbi:hypothetical protein [Halobellus captivus]|uniref:hypothetical protein n=1 Tax=Halobellus captivus TaxID=2592614 RepID=UPI0011A3BF66|nr:hypothetical protein [Halobellus captivus]
MHDDAPDGGHPDDADSGDDTDETVRCWLVERTYTDRGLVDTVYATPDGSKAHRKQVSTTIMRQRGVGTTAAVDVDASDLEPVDDGETRDRYASEVERVREQYGPDDEV